MKNTLKNNKIKILIVFFIIGTIIGFIFIQKQNAENTITTIPHLTAETIAVSDYATGAIGSFAPTANGDSFVVRSESGGRVNSVINENQKISKGQVIAKIENSSQLASLTQAQGAYEATLANSKQSTFGIENKEEILTSNYTSAKSTLRSSLISSQNIVEETIDYYFSGLEKATLDLNDYVWDKKLIDYALERWDQSTILDISDEEISSHLDTAISVSEDISTLLNILYNKVLNEEKNTSTDYRETLNGYKSDINSVKTIITTNIQSLRNTKLNITDAESDLRRTLSSSIGGNTSAVEASIKQALGALQAAEAMYEKTIIKAPFDGTLTSLNVHVGDIISLGTDIAIIIPENTSETEKSFDLPLSSVKYTPGGAYVFTANSQGVLNTLLVTTGLVRAENINVQGLTGSEHIIKDVRGLKAGDVINTK